MLGLEERDLEADNGDRRRAVVIDCADWVNIVALVEGDRPEPAMVMVRQWRFGIGDFTLEVPGGMVDPGEEASQAALRELEEETGYRAREVTYLGVVEPNPALQSNRTTSWLATGLAKTGGPQGDGDEELEVLEVPLSEVEKRVARGEIRHALVLSALFWWQRHRDGGELDRR